MKPTFAAQWVLRAAAPHLFSMIARYHLDLAALALALGVVVLVVTMRVPVFASRAVAVAAAGGAVLGSMGNPRGIVWVAPALLVVLPADDDRRPHPLGRFTLALTVVALAGIWSAVPDTEPPLAASFALAPISLWYLAGRRAPGVAATAAAIVAMAGAVWVGSAGWGAAVATVGAIGLIATAPMVFGFGAVRCTTTLTVLVSLQFMVGLLLPRFVMSRDAHIAGGVSIGVNAVFVLVSVALVGASRVRSPEREAPSD